VSESVADEIIRKIAEAAGLYNRLILLVAPSGSGKTEALRCLSERLGAAVVNLNLELTRRMLDLTERQRTLQIPQSLHEIINHADSEVVLFDNIEILFDSSLKQDPLRLFERASRNKTIVVSWNGLVKNNYLIYAEPDYPEYKQYPIQHILLVERGCSLESTKL
jgi:chromosomal replication initiation ATPase DnaA